MSSGATKSFNSARKFSKSANYKKVARLAMIVGSVALTGANWSHAAILTWTGTTNKTWDDVATDVNWVDSTATPAVYSDGSAVTFTDSTGGAVATPITITVGTTSTPTAGVAPSSITFSDNGGTTGAYQFADSAGATSGITGSTSLTLNSGYNGIVLLNAVNTYTGGTFVNGGTFRAGTGSLAANATVTLGGGVFETSTGSGSTYTASQNFVVTSGTTTSGLLPANTSTNPAFNGLFTTSAGATPLNTTLNIQTTSQTITTINFANANTATPTSSFAGTVAFGSGGTMRVTTGSPNAVFDLGSGTATLAASTGGTTIYLGGLKGGATTILSGAAAGTSANTTYVIGSAGQSTTFSGLINAGAKGRPILQVVGGALTLTNGSQTFSTNSGNTGAAITIFGGALYVDNVTGSGTGPSGVFVNGGTIGGTGLTNGIVAAATTGIVTVNQVAAASYALGGHVAPGSAGSSVGSTPGTLTLSNGLVLNDFSNLDETLNGASTVTGNDLVSTANLTAPLSGNVQVNLNVVNPASLVSGSVYDLVNYSGTLTNDPTLWAITGVPAGYTAAITDTGPSNGQVDVTFTAIAVPEPTTFAVLGLAAAGLLGRRRRRV